MIGKKAPRAEEIQERIAITNDKKNARFEIFLIIAPQMTIKGNLGNHQYGITIK